MHDTPAEADKFVTKLPFYPLDIAAGEFMDSTIPGEPGAWFEMDGLTSSGRFSTDMFVAQVQGKSMEPLIPDGAFCLFSFEVGGSRNGRIVLAQKHDMTDQDTGAGYTVKSYSSTKRVDPDTGWQHNTITLKAVNPDYDDISIPPEEAGDFRIVAFFVEVLTT